MQYLFLKQLATTYNCGAYGASSYNSKEPCQTTTQPGTGVEVPATGDILTPSGTNMMVGVIAGLLIILIATILLVRTRKKK